MNEFVPPASKTDIIDRTIAILNKHGHAKGSYRKDDRYCLMGAIYTAAYGYAAPFSYGISTEKYKSITDDIGNIVLIMRNDPAIPVFSNSLDQIVAYNDADGTNLEDVIGLLRRTKEKLKMG